RRWQGLRFTPPGRTALNFPDSYVSSRAVAQRPRRGKEHSLVGRVELGRIVQKSPRKWQRLRRAPAPVAVMGDTNHPDARERGVRHKSGEIKLGAVCTEAAANLVIHGADRSLRK